MLTLYEPGKGKRRVKKEIAYAYFITIVTVNKKTLISQNNV